MSIYSAYLGDFLSYQGQNTICSTRYINQVLLFLEIIIVINILKNSIYAILYTVKGC